MELRDYLKLFSLNYDAFVKTRSVRTDQVHTPVRYEKLTNVTRIDGLKNEAFFFKDGMLRIIYISNELLTAKLWKAFQQSADIARPEQRVRSRAGKTSNQLIFASRGLTASITGKEVDFIELYAPCTVQEYLEHIYDEPGLFIR